jgi:hypothetical protein
VFSCEINILLKNKIFIDLQKEEEKEKKRIGTLNERKTQRFK